MDRVISALDSEGVTALKYLFSTHSDDDHIGGYSPLLHAQRYEMGEFLSPNAMSYKDKAGFHQMVMTAVRKHEIPYRVLEDGEVLTLGDAQLTVLRCMENWGRNARSACLSIRFGDSSMLLTGDLTAQAMQHYLGKYDHDLLRADILKVPHHGVITIPPAFMDAVAPQFMFLNNTSEKAAAFTRDMERRGVTVPMLYAGDGAVVLVTNGVDWYIWQEENW